MNEKSNFCLKLKATLDKSVIGQNSYKKALSVHITELFFDGNTSPILVIGPTGNGKTYTVMALEKALHTLSKKFTVLTVDATSLSATGYQGADFSGVMKEYKKRCIRDNNADFIGLIFIDEFDKICRPSIASDGENISYATQATLLTALEPTKDLYGFDTSKILFILSGAFTEIYDSKVNKTPFGFGQNVPPTESALMSTIILRKEILEYGCIRELMGRITDLIEIKELDSRQLASLISHPQKGYIAQLQKQYREYGLELEFTSDMLSLIVAYIKKQGLGARGIKTVINSLLSTSLYDAIEMDGVNKVLIHKDMFNGAEAIYMNDDRKLINKENG